MVFCSVCDSWVHIKCEGMSNEYYEILSNLPDNVEYKCPVCDKGKRKIWLSAVKNVLHTGISYILDILLSTVKANTPKPEKKLPPVVNYCAEDVADVLNELIANVVESQRLDDVSNVVMELVEGVVNNERKEVCRSVLDKLVDDVVSNPVEIKSMMKLKNMFNCKVVLTDLYSKRKSNRTRSKNHITFPKLKSEFGNKDITSLLRGFRINVKKQKVVTPEHVMKSPQTISSSPRDKISNSPEKVISFNDIFNIGNITNTVEPEPVPSHPQVEEKVEEEYVSPMMKALLDVQHKHENGYYQSLKEFHKEVIAACSDDSLGSDIKILFLSLLFVENLM